MRKMEISEPKVRSTTNMQKTTERNVFFVLFFSAQVELEFLLHVVHFFVKFLVNCLMLDFVLDPRKRSLRTRRLSNNRARERIRAHA